MIAGQKHGRSPIMIDHAKGSIQMTSPKLEALADSVRTQAEVRRGVTAAEKTAAHNRKMHMRRMERLAGNLQGMVDIKLNSALKLDQDEGYRLRDDAKALRWMLGFAREHFNEDGTPRGS